ncbi:MAG: NUDIX domain-containing protein, partial [bacterium]|nr:NUDIX domain-containing protein [bacterium]
ETGDLELLAVKRADTGHWAIPGGMVDFGEDVSKTLCRELEEETGLTLDMSHAHEVYRGYVDDRRTTDHAWIETMAKHTHLSSENAHQASKLRESEEGLPQWLPLTKDSIGNLYASHGFVVARSLEYFANQEKEKLAPDVYKQITSLIE